MSDEPLLTPTQFETMRALSDTFRVFHEILADGETSPAMVRMLAASLRATADVMDEIATDWESV